MRYKFQAERGLVAPRPIPPRSLYPWPLLGDKNVSFFVPCTDRTQQRKTRRSILGCGKNWCRQNKPTLMPITEVTPEGVRTWLVPMRKRSKNSNH